MPFLIVIIALFFGLMGGVALACDALADSSKRSAKWGWDECIKWFDVEGEDAEVITRSGDEAFEELWGNKR